MVIHAIVASAKNPVGLIPDDWIWVPQTFMRGLRKNERVNLAHSTQYLEHFWWKLAAEYAANFAKFSISSILCIALLPNLVL